MANSPPLKEEYLPAGELMERLAISRHQLAGAKRNGGVQPKGKNRNTLWPLYATARYFAERPLNGKQYPEARAKAEAILAEAKDKEGAPLPAPCSHVMPEGQGIEAALTRLRHAEEIVASRFWQSLENGESTDRITKEWSSIVDLLRKAEGNLDDLRIARKELLSAGEVRTWYSRQIETAKTALLDMPAKLGPKLEGQPWNKITEIMERELYDILERLSDTDYLEPVE